MVTCGVKVDRYGGVCGDPAVVMVAVRPNPECSDIYANNTAAFCQYDYDRVPHLISVGAVSPCGCAVLEVIDLTKADPGPGYADMLRSL